MIEYIKFWLAQALTGLIITGVVILLAFIAFLCWCAWDWIRERRKS